MAKDENGKVVQFPMHRVRSGSDRIYSKRDITDITYRVKPQPEGILQEPRKGIRNAGLIEQWRTKIEEKTQEMETNYDVLVRKLCKPLGERRGVIEKNVMICAYLVGHAMNQYDEAKRTTEYESLVKILEAIEQVVHFVKQEIQLFTGEGLIAAYNITAAMLSLLGERMEQEMEEVPRIMGPGMERIIRASMYAKRIEEMRKEDAELLRGEIGCFEEPYKSILLKTLEHKLRV
jgi:hypothetical protein